MEGRRWARWIFLGVVAATLMDRIFLLFLFGFQHTGSDDVLFWEVARDMAAGILREPYLYGQNYNPALESLLAVPLLWASVPFQVAMPLVTSLLALAPFLSFAWWYGRQGSFSQATLFAAVPLLLPVEWGLMTMITRGFVTGLALFAWLPWLAHLRDERIRAVVTGALLYAAVLFNPNALLFALPYFLHSMLRSGAPVRNSLLGASGALPMIALHAAAHAFLVERSERVVHRLDDWRLTFHPGELIPEALHQLDLHFAWLCPAWWPHGQVVLAAIAAMVMVLAWGQRWKAAAALVSVIVLVVVSFAFPKVHDGFPQVFYPYSRMYLALPLVLAWSATLLPVPRSGSIALLVLMAITTTCFLPLKMLRTTDVIAAQLADQQHIPVCEVSMGQFQEEVRALREATDRTGADLVVCFDRPDPCLSLLLTHGGQCLDAGLPPTLYVGIDRRWWRRQEERVQVRKGVLFVGGTEDEWRTAHERVEGIKVVRLGKDTAHFLADAGLPLDTLLVQFGRRID